MKNTLNTFALIFFCLSSALSQDLAGIWHGITQNPDGQEITFVFFFEKAENGYQVTMAVPTFNVAGIKPKSNSLQEGKLIIEEASLGMKYQGQWSEASQQFEGSYTEGQMNLKLTLKRGNPPRPMLNRPQAPKKPYPYYEEKVIFFNTEAKVQLVGTFTRPSAPGHYPVVVLISGSGRHDRDGSMATHRPFLVLADYLTRNNIAVLRYDDRGFAESTGDFSQATTADFAQDVLSAVTYLKSRSDINPQQIGLIGHSEGGIIAPLVANQSADIAFIVSLAGTGIPGREVAVMQSKSLRPFPVEDEIAFEQNVRKALDIASSDMTFNLKQKALFMHNFSYLKPILQSLGADDKNIEAFAQKETEALLKPWNQYFYNYNPALEFEKVQIPVLSLNGSKDVQVDANINQNAIRAALEKGANKQYCIKELKGLNHLYQECKTGKLDEYPNIEQTFSPVALTEISDWILAQVANK